ncbi:hypothetical protein PUR59_04440 [Streptomyces sp. SP18ES09]|uniref:hypothetical protein n=1 Tax=Streptomyces sp. SP18ES09 TaxID=3002532 RepID=UPI002E7844F7|nr:hypothetical protein [Streptomyces sp. SP18ES09]MEE1814270.1 hypothetical protein [Streptomyces sp. SP18ES09]
MALAARYEDGELLVLLNPQATPERIRDDLASTLGHFISNGLLAWTGGPQEQGLP